MNEELFSLASASIQAPAWTDVPPSRRSEQKGTLGALEDRMPLQHQYRNAGDIDNWAHETSHGLHSILRNKLNPNGNALFVPDRWCCLVADPTGVKLATIAQKVPASWRGMSYQLYLQQMQQYWNNEPTYVLDEWVSYANGLQASYEYQKDVQSSSAQQMIEFMGYAWTLFTLGADEQLRNFILWYSYRTVKLLNHVASSIDASKARSHLERLRTSQDGATITATVASHGSDDWKREVLG